MFGIFKKQFKLLAPISGRVIDLSETPDPIFSKRLAGEGIAIDPTGDIVVAPVDGMLSAIFRTNHAFGITMENGTDVLVHIGIDTVDLEGQGFIRLAKEGQEIKAGEPVLKIDRQFIQEKGFSLISPVIVTNASEISGLQCNINFVAEAGKDVIFTFKK